jgi:hypothetical protein
MIQTIPGTSLIPLKEWTSNAYLHSILSAIDTARFCLSDDAAGMAVLGKLLGQLKVLVFLIM